MAKATVGRRRTRVLIVDDHPVVRLGVAQLVAAEPDLEVCGEAASAGAAFKGLGETRPDVVVVDLSLEDRSGLELVKDIRAAQPAVKVLVLSMHEESVYAERALRAGAMGYVMKENAPAAIIAAIRRVARNQVYVSDSMSARLLHQIVHGRAPDAEATAALSDRELEVFEAIGEGMPNRDIARKLCLSVKTIETYREALKHKLNQPDAAALMRYAIAWRRDRAAARPEPGEAT